MDNQHGDDAAVIAASASNAELFAVIFDRHGAHLHRYLSRRLGADAADDLLADVFLTAFRRRDRYDRTRPDARPWLYGIAAHAVAGHRRAQARRWRLLAALPTDRDDQPGPAEEAEDRLDARAGGRELAQALAGLNAAEREVLLLVAWEHMTYEQIAEVLEIPVGTVRSRLSRGRSKIRRRLGGVDPRLAGDAAAFDTNATGSAEFTDFKLRELLRNE